jgi:alpha-N-acetylglucosamine transferase
MEQILRVFKNEDYDRYIFITYKDNKIVGLNFHQGIYDLGIDWFFSKPDVYLTQTFMKMIANNPIDEKDDAYVFLIINDAIDVVSDIINYRL